MGKARIKVTDNSWEIGLECWQLKQDVHTLEHLLTIKQWLEECACEGGIIQSKEEVLLENNHKIIDASNWLTEELNIPFVYAENFEQMTAEIEKIPWELTYYGIPSDKDEYSIESLLTVGNGFLGIRGTTPEMEINDQTYPATYLSGLYNTLETNVYGQGITNEDFVNIPNFQTIYLEIARKKIMFSKENILKIKRSLNLKNGLFQSWILIELADGKRLKIHVKKIANMKQVNQYHLLYQVTPLNFSDEITLVSQANGGVYNYNVARYRSLSNQHLVIEELKADKELAAMKVKTTQSQITICQFSELVSSDLDLTKIENKITDKLIEQSIQINAQQGKSYTIEKNVWVDKYHADEPTAPLHFKYSTVSDFSEFLQQSSQAWDELWKKSKIAISGDIMSQKLIHLNTYHLLVSASPNGNKNLDASITARGLHGEAYRGHIFWDEVFIFPFYLIHFPQTAEELLMYRYRRLNTAKQAAEEIGYKGAMFPWQSGLDGSEQSQKLHLNPVSGEWKEDHSRLQRHVSLAIAYNVWSYFEQTENHLFMEKYGIEMLLEIAHFWESKAVWNEKKKRYVIEGVMGPDEFHEKYPRSQEKGLKNNAYTNVMVVWLFKKVEFLTQTFSEKLLEHLKEKVGMSNDTFLRMKKIQTQVNLEIDSAGIIAQFEGYEQLKNINWEVYQEKYGNLSRLDRILNALGESADDYQIAKQADTLMLFYLLKREDIESIFVDLNYNLPQDYLEKNFSYYLNRTSHGSTLSRIVYAYLAAMTNHKKLSWSLYQEALFSDYRDIQGGTTAEGIHTGVMGATLHVTLAIFAGIDYRQDKLQINPSLPKGWEELSFQLDCKGINYQVTITKERIAICTNEKAIVKIFDEEKVIMPDNWVTISY